MDTDKHCHTKQHSTKQFWQQRTSPQAPLQGAATWRIYGMSPEALSIYPENLITTAATH